MSSLMRAVGSGWFAWLALWLAACGRDTAGDLELSVVDDRGEGLAEVALRLDDHVIAHSGADGKLVVAPGQVALGGSLTAECPEAYRPVEPLSLSPSASLLPRSLQFVCRPRLRTLAVVAYVPAAVGALLRADTQALGRVTADGTLHAVLRRPPGATVQLSLDAQEAQAALKRTVKIRDRDEIIVLDAER